MDYILGVAVSLVVEAIKNYGSTNKVGTMLSLLVLSIVAGMGYVYLSSQDYFPTITAILLSASAFHNLVWRQLQSK